MHDSRLLALVLMVVCAYFVVLRPSIRGNDGVQNYAYLHSVMFDSDLDFSNEYGHYFALEATWFDSKQIPRDPVTNLPINLYGVGSSLLWAPWVGTFHLAGKAVNALGGHLVLDGYSPLYERAVAMGSCFYASLGLLLLFGLLRRYFASDNALWAVLLVWLASPLFFYMYLHPSMSHANSFFLAALLLSVYLGGDSLRRWVAMGVVSGLLVLTRYQDAFLLLALVPGELMRFYSSSPEERTRFGARVLRYALFGITAALVFSPQLFVWHTLQGSMLSGPRAYMTQGKIDLLAPTHLTQVLFSSRHGLLFWHPGLMLALAGLLIPSLMREKLVCFTAFFAQLWIVSAWSIWWAGASFGQRMFISSLPFLAFGAGALFHSAARIGLWLRLLILVLILWNFGLIVQYGTGMIPRQTGVEFRQLLYNNFVRIPRKVFGK